MNWKSTVVLVLLAGAAGAWFFQGDVWGPRLGIGSSDPEPPPSASIAALDALTPASISRVEVVFPSGDPLVLERTPSGPGWTMPGNWPVRTAEVERLVETLGSLRSRFQPVPLGENADLTPFGLAPAQKPLTVRLVTAGRPLTLTLGEPEPAAGDTAFTRTAFVRVDNLPEVVKLGPDVLPVVRRPSDTYRRRHLFPDVERVRLATPVPPVGPLGIDRPAEAGVPVTLPGERTESLTVHRPVPSLFGLDLSPVFGGFTLVRTGQLPAPAPTSKGGEPVVRPDRLADAWQVLAPAPAPADPAKLRGILTAVAELWVEKFVATEEATPALDGPAGFVHLSGLPLPLPVRFAVCPFPEAAVLQAARSRLSLDEWTGFVPNGPAVTVKRRGADPVTVRFGGLARISERTEEAEPGSFAPPQTVRTVLRYARVEGNPQLFLVSDKNLPDLLAVTRPADPRVARFTTEEVREVTVAVTGRPPFTLRRSPAAGSDGSASSTNSGGSGGSTGSDDRRDRWQIEAKPNPLAAETNSVNDLLDRLGRLSADADDRVLYPPDPGPAQTVVTVLASEKRPAGTAPAPVRQYRLAFGKPQPDRGLVPVWVEGRPRVCLVENWLTPPDPESWIASLLFPPDTLSALVARPAITYRAKKLFDATRESLSGITAAGFTLRRVGETWRLTAPLDSPADPTAAAALADTLAGLTATEFLTDAPTPAELKAYGLDKPGDTLSLAFTDGRNYTLEIGGPRPGKNEVFARLDGGGVLALPKSATEPLLAGALGLLPRQVWAVAPEKVTTLEVVRTGDEAGNSFLLSRDGADWKLTGPFTAPVPEANARPLLTSLGTLTVDKYHALAATDPAPLGLDKPFLVLKLVSREPLPEGSGEVPVRRTLLIGQPTADKTGRFARLDTPNAPVFIVPESFVTAAGVKPLDLPERNLLSLEAGRVTAVRVNPGPTTDAFTLTKDANGKWTAEGSTFGIDAERIQELTRTAARPPVIRLVAYGEAVKWADYGLDKPALTVTVTTDGDKPQTHTIALGSPDPTASRYARIDDKPAVVLIPAGAVEVLSRKKFEYADRTLLTFDPTTLVGLSRTRGKEELELVAAAAVGWDLVKPGKHKADTDLVEELGSGLGNLRAERAAGFGKKDEVFKQYGLEPPAALISVTAGDKAATKTLRIGNPVNPAEPEGDRYAAVDSPAPEVLVGVLPAAFLKKLLAPPVAFRDRTLAKFVDADRATLERAGRKITFAKVGVTWKVTEPLAAPAESGELEALLADLGSLRVETWVAEKTGDLKPFGLDKPQAKWTVFNDDKPVLVLLVGNKTADGNCYVASESGELVGLLSAALTGRVLAEYRQRRPWDVDAAQIETVTLDVPGGKFTLEKVGSDWTDPVRRTDPIDPAVVNELVATLGALRVDRYAADTDADPKLFGFEKPEATLTVTERTGSPKVLEVGGVVGGTDGKQRYARVVEKNRSDVFVLSPADTARLTRDRSVYLRRK